MLNLAQDRFSKTTLTKRFFLDGKIYDTEYARYTYESHDKIYDVDIRKSDSSKSYHINCGFETEPNKYHKAILEHFKI